MITFYSLIEIMIKSSGFYSFCLSLKRKVKELEFYLRSLVQIKSPSSFNTPLSTGKFSICRNAGMVDRLNLEFSNLQVRFLFSVLSAVACYLGESYFPQVKKSFK